MKKFKYYLEKTKEEKSFKKAKIDDQVLFGKFKNKKAVIINFGTDKNNQPTVIIKPGGEKPLYNFRIKKLMPKKKG